MSWAWRRRIKIPKLVEMLMRFERRWRPLFSIRRTGLRMIQVEVALPFSHCCRAKQVFGAVCCHIWRQGSYTNIYQTWAALELSHAPCPVYPPWFHWNLWVWDFQEEFQTRRLPGFCTSKQGFCSACFSKALYQSSIVFLFSTPSGSDNRGNRKSPIEFDAKMPPLSAGIFRPRLPEGKSHLYKLRFRWSQVKSPQIRIFSTVNPPTSEVGCADAVPRLATVRTSGGFNRIRHCMAS